MYIDTENTFRPQRLVQIAEKFGLDPDSVLDNVAYAQAHTCEAQASLLLHMINKGRWKERFQGIICR